MVNTPKIFISAFVGSNNLGDEAIFQSIVANLAINRSTTRVTTVNAQKTATYGVIAVSMKNPVALYHCIARSDIVLMGGGGILQDQSSFMNMLLYGYQLLLARWLKKPVVLCFVGVGPLKYRMSRWLLRMAAPTVQLAIVRDHESKDQLMAATRGHIRTIHVFHDPVLNYPLNDSGDKREDLVAVSLRKWFFSVPFLPAKLARKLNSHGFRSKKYEQLVQVLARELDEFLHHHPTTIIQFVSMYDEEDIEVTERVRRLMQHSDRTRAPQKNMTADAFIALARRSKLVIAMRLHALILGSVAHTPFSAIDYSFKVGAFAAQMEQGTFSRKVGDFEEGSFFSAWHAAYKSAEKNQATITRLQKQYARENIEAFKKIQQQIDGAD